MALNKKSWPCYNMNNCPPSLILLIQNIPLRAPTFICCASLFFSSLSLGSRVAYQLYETQFVTFCTDRLRCINSLTNPSMQNKLVTNVQTGLSQITYLKLSVSLHTFSYLFFICNVSLLGTNWTQCHTFQVLLIAFVLQFTQAQIPHNSWQKIIQLAFFFPQNSFACTSSL